MFFYEKLVYNMNNKIEFLFKIKKIFNSFGTKLRSFGLFSGILSYKPCWCPAPVVSERCSAPIRFVEKEMTEKFKECSFVTMRLYLTKYKIGNNFGTKLRSFGLFSGILSYKPCWCAAPMVSERCSAPTRFVEKEMTEKFKERSFVTMTLCLLLLPIISFSQSLDSLISTTFANNLELQILEKQYQSKLQVAGQIAPRPDPEIGVGVFPLPVETRLGSQVARLSGTQMFPQKGMVQAKKELANAAAEPIIAQINARKLDLAYQVKIVWLQVYELDKSREIIGRNIRILKSLEALALIKVETGKVNPADVLRVQLKIQALENQMLILKKEREKPLAELKQVLNTNENIVISISDNLVFSTLIYSKDNLFANIQANHPMMKMYELQQEISKKAMAVNALNNQPTFGVGLDYINVIAGNDAEPKGNGRDIIQLKATVKIPLYKNQYAAKNQEELLKIEAWELQKESTTGQFLMVIEKAFTDYELANLEMDLYAQQVVTTKAAIDFLKSSYSVDGRNFEELLQMEKELIDYDLMILKAIVKSHKAKIMVEKFVD
jgi:outer membrane protein TolC